MLCNLCPHNCNIDRQIKPGRCGAPADFKIAHAMVHHWEEPCISGTNGSGAIFFSHCNLNCVYCQNHEISQSGYGKLTDSYKLKAISYKLAEKGVQNINLISPTPYTESIIKVLPQIKTETNLPIIWNSNAYEKVETLKKLDGLIDVYLPDFKYYDNQLAVKYSGAPNYREIALAAITEMVRQTGIIKLDNNDLIKKGVIIRHLVLPGQIEDSKKILQLIKDNFGDTVWVSLMSQYYPIYRASEFPEINRSINIAEYNKIKDVFDALDFAGGYFQELESAHSNFIPKFDTASINN